MIKFVWILVVLIHIGFGIFFLGVVAIEGAPKNFNLEDWVGLLSLVLGWVAYLVALIGNRAGQDTLLGLAIEARKAELRRRIREREKSD